MTSKTDGTDSTADLQERIERLEDELAYRKRQQVIMYSCLQNISEGQSFEGCKRAAEIALIAVRQITADMLEVERDAADE